MLGLMPASFGRAQFGRESKGFRSDAVLA